MQSSQTEMRGVLVKKCGDYEHQTHSWKYELIFPNSLCTLPSSLIILGNFKAATANATDDRAKSTTGLWKCDPDLIGHLHDAFILIRSFVNAISAILSSPVMAEGILKSGSKIYLYVK
jgi:hypothetical protein